MKRVISCDMNINHECKGEKFFGQPCGSLKMMLCTVRKRMLLEQRLKKEMIESDQEQQRSLGAC